MTTTQNLATAALVAAVAFAGCSGAAPANNQPPSVAPDYSAELAAICWRLEAQNQQLSRLDDILAVLDETAPHPVPKYGGPVPTPVAPPPPC